MPGCGRLWVLQLDSVQVCSKAVQLNKTIFEDGKTQRTAEMTSEKSETWSLRESVPVGERWEHGVSLYVPHLF